MTAIYHTSQFTALAFIEQTLKQDPFKKIICLERGGTIYLITRSFHEVNELS
jgi:hypothetical protein